MIKRELNLDKHYTRRGTIEITNENIKGGCIKVLKAAAVEVGTKNAPRWTSILHIGKNQKIQKIVIKFVNRKFAVLALSSR